MRRAFALAVVAALALPLLAADETVVLPHPEAAPESVTVLFAGQMLDRGLRLLDTAGEEVPGRIEATGYKERVFVPETSPLPEGQYTVDLPELGLTRTFTVGPDRYPPRIVAVGPGALHRDTPVEIRLSEPVAAGTVTSDAVKVFDLSSGEPRRVSGMLWVDREGTRVTFTPRGWPGFTPEGRFRVEIVEDELEDLSGNTMSPTIVQLVGDVEPVGAGLPRVPEAVYWSSRTTLGMLGLAGRGSHSARIGDPAEIVLDPRVDLSGAGVAYGVNPKGDLVLAVDTSTGEVFGEAEVRSPSGLAIHPSGLRLYVASKKDGTLLAFDTTAAADRSFKPEGPVATAQVGRSPRGVAVSPDGKLVACVSARDSLATVLDAVTLEVLFVLPTDRRPEDAAFVSRGESSLLLLVTCRGRRKKAGSVVVFDPERGERVATLGGFSRPRRLTARDSRVFIAEEAAGRIAVLEVPAAGPPVRTGSLPAGRRPTDVAVAPDGSGEIYAVNRGRGTLTVTGVEGIRATIKAPGVLAVATWRER